MCYPQLLLVHHNYMPKCPYSPYMTYCLHRIPRNCLVLHLLHKYHYNLILDRRDNHRKVSHLHCKYHTRQQQHRHHKLQHNLFQASSYHYNHDLSPDKYIIQCWKLLLDYRSCMHLHQHIQCMLNYLRHKHCMHHKTLSLRKHPYNQFHKGNFHHQS